MSIRLFFISLFLWSLAIHPSSAQMIADFTFDDTSDMPVSLKKNAAGADAHSINPKALSDGQGVYTLADPNSMSGYAPSLDLKISEELFNQTESIYLEFDYRSLEEFAWLINSGHNLFRFAHVNYPDDPSRQGFHVRYSTKANPANIIESGYVGTPLNKGERATIGFMYDMESGYAYIFKNGQEIWRTPDALVSPGYGLHWQTTDGFLYIGSNMNGDGSNTPFLYRFRAFENACVSVLPPVAEGQSCKGEAATFTASGGEEGQYRWYASKGEVIYPIEGAVNSTYVTPEPYEAETYYVSVASDICESPMVPVTAKIKLKPEIKDIQVVVPCGPGEATVSWQAGREMNEFYVYSRSGSRTVKQEKFLTLDIKQDTLVYLSASNGFCESEAVPVQIKYKELPTIDAGRDRTILKGESIDLMATGEFESLYWEIKESLQYPDSPSPLVTPDSTTTYVVRALNENGCEVSDSVTVFVKNSFPVPNAFSPNQDGNNDTWEIPNIENYPSCRIIIFNRWGNELFSSEGYKEPWDGTQNGNPLPFGTYYYTLDLGGGKELIQGSILLIP